MKESIKILSQQLFLIFWVIILSLFLPTSSFSQTSGIAGIWAIDDCEKITQIDLTHPFISSSNNTVWNGSTISLFGAQNEVIAFQLIINATGSGANNVTVRLDSLISSSYVITNTGGIGDPMNYVGKRIELFVESYINVTTKSTQFIQPAAAPPSYYSGQIPDALVPFEVGQSKGGAPFNIAPNLSQGVWADIYIPKDAPPDIYSGKVVVYENGVVRYNIPVSLKVYGFALSDSTHFRNMFVVDPDDLRTKHGVIYNTSQYYAILDNYYKMAHRHRMDLNVYYTPSNLSQQAAGYFTGSSYTLTNGYEGPGANIGHGTYGIGTYDQPDNGATSGFDPATEAGWRAASDTWVSWFKANAPSTVIFKFMTDEPDSTQYAVIKQRASWLHNNPGVGKELKTFCTVKIDPRLYGYIDFWALAGQAGYDAGDHITYGYVSSKVAERKAAGNKIAIYGDARPSYGLSEVIDVEVADSRVNPWIGWKYKNVDMFFGWGLNKPSWKERTINAWVDNYLTFNGGSNYIWGMGNFLYTGQNKVFTAYDKGILGPIASIRMKNWRRGQQDYEYLWLASQLGLQSQVDSIVNSIVPVAFDGYSKSNSAPSWPLRGYAYELARKKIAELIGQKLVGQTLAFLYANPTSLSFDDIAITTSSERAYTLTGSSLIPASGNIVVTAPSSAYQVSLTSGSGFSSSLNVPYTSGTLYPTTIYVRFSPTAVQNYTGNITNAGGGATTKSVVLVGTGASTTAPTLTVNPTLLSFGNITINTNSIAQIYTVRGTNLSPASGNIIITPPPGYQVSSGSGMSSSLNVPYTGGTLSSTTIYVRFSPTAMQSYTGNITNTGGGALTKNIAVNGTGASITASNLTVNPTSLSFGNVTINTNSSVQIFILQGTNLSPASGNIIITPPSGYQVSATSGSGFSSSLNIPYTGGALSSTTIYVRFSPTAVQSYTGNITSAGGGATTKNVAVTGTGASITASNLTVNPTSLSFGNVTINTNSIVQIYTLQGANLSPASGNIVITPPSGYQVSIGSGMSSSLNVPYTGGTLSSTTIYVRFSPTAVQSYTGNITSAGGGATTKNVAVTGTGASTTAPTLTVNPTSLSFGNVTINTNSIVQIYTLQGANLSPASGNIVITPPSGYQVSIGSGMSSSLNVPYTGGNLSSTTIYVRFSPTAVQSYSGNITSAGGGATTKNVAVTGTGASTTAPTLTVNQTSLSFGNVTINTNSSVQIYTLQGANLSPASGNITITPPSGYQVSVGSGMSSSLNVPYTDSTLSSKTIFVKFSPTAVQSYTGNITNTGGGATTKNVALTGTGVSSISAKLLEWLSTNIYSESTRPKDTKLKQNYPNPFNPSTIINYQLSDAGKVRLSVYDILGHEIATLVNGEKEAGIYSETFNGSKLSSGVYFTRFVFDSENGKQIVQVKKIFLAK